MRHEFTNHCGPTAPYGVIYCGKYWFKWCLGAYLARNYDNGLEPTRRKPLLEPMINYKCIHASLGLNELQCILVISQCVQLFKLYFIIFIISLLKAELTITSLHHDTGRKFSSYSLNIYTSLVEIEIHQGSHLQTYYVWDWGIGN